MSFKTKPCLFKAQIWIGVPLACVFARQCFFNGSIVAQFFLESHGEVLEITFQKPIKLVQAIWPFNSGTFRVSQLRPCCRVGLQRFVTAVASSFLFETLINSKEASQDEDKHLAALPLSR